MKGTELAINNGNIAMRALLLINGGAAIAILPFASNVYAANPVYFTPFMGQLLSPLTNFSWGVVFVTVGMLTAYFANYALVEMMGHKKAIMKHPYLEITPKSSFWDRVRLLFHFLTTVLTLTSVLNFYWGITDVASAFRLMGNIPSP